MQLKLDIQGLRALAVLLVILFHIDESFLPGGFIGVDIFFVISGFLISKSIITSLDKGHFSLVKFFEGRLKRIVPAYYFMLLLAIIVAVLVYIPTDFNTFFHQLKRTFIFASNQLFTTTDDYFGAKSYENSLLHTWSLGIEMQFYLFLPLFLMVVPKRWRVIAFSLMFFVFLMYAEYNIRLSDQKAQMYFSLGARSIEFIIGIAINLVPSFFKLINKKVKEFGAVLALLVILASSIFLNANSAFPGLLSLPACLATAYIIGVENTSVNRMLATSLPNYIGKISYSLYLWHWPVLSFYRYYSMQYTLSAMEIVGIVVVFSLLSLLSFYLIEEKFRQLIGIRFYAVFGGLTVLMGIIWLGSARMNQRLVDIPEPYISPKAFNNNNHNQYSSYELLGDKSSGKDDKILVIGDSHGLGLLPFLDATGKKYRFNFSTISMNHYPPLPGLYLDNLTNKIDKSAYGKLSTIADSLIDHSRIIILVKYWPGPSDFSEAYDYLYKKMDSEQSLVILSDIPHLAKNPVRRYKSLLKPKNTDKEEIKKPEFSDEVLAFAKGKPNVYFLDIFDDTFFREAPYYKDTLMYIDESHINFYGSMKLVEYQGDKVSGFILELLNK